MTAPKKDPSAMGLIEGLLTRWQDGGHMLKEDSNSLVDGILTLRKLSLAKRHARNVTKQRRRLLAEKCDRILLALTHGPTDADIVRAVKRGKAPDYGEAYHLLAARNRRRATKLRALAERLRATG